MAAHIEEIAPDLHHRVVDGRRTPEQVLKSIVDGINTGNLDQLMPLYEPEAAFATQPGSPALRAASSIRSMSDWFLEGIVIFQICRFQLGSALRISAPYWRALSSSPSSE